MSFAPLPPAKKRGYCRAVFPRDMDGTVQTGGQVSAHSTNLSVAHRTAVRYSAVQCRTARTAGTASIDGDSKCRTLATDGYTGIALAAS